MENLWENIKNFIGKITLIELMIIITIIAIIAAVAIQNISRYYKTKELREQGLSEEQIKEQLIPTANSVIMNDVSVFEYDGCKFLIYKGYEQGGVTKIYCERDRQLMEDLIRKIEALRIQTEEY